MVCVCVAREVLAVQLPRLAMLFPSTKNAAVVALQSYSKRWNWPSLTLKFNVFDLKPKVRVRESVV